MLRGEGEKSTQFILPNSTMVLLCPTFGVRWALTLAGDELPQW